MISLIVAAAKNRMIGKNNDFPWHLSGDFKRFRKLTTGHAVIMGRKTYEHLIARIGKPLPNRLNIVVTRNKAFSGEGVTIVHSIKEALQQAHSTEAEVFVIGGAELFKATLPLADRIYLTGVDVEPEGDAFFPATSPAEWQEVSREPHVKDEKNNYNYTFITLEKC